MGERGNELLNGDRERDGMADGFGSHASAGGHRRNERIRGWRARRVRHAFAATASAYRAQERGDD